jgi:hypothetical protein
MQSSVIAQGRATICDEIISIQPMDPVINNSPDAVIGRHWSVDFALHSQATGILPGLGRFHALFVIG